MGMQVDKAVGMGGGELVVNADRNPHFFDGMAFGG
jgi:hypothetical protein